MKKKSEIRLKVVCGAAFLVLWSLSADKAVAEDFDYSLYSRLLKKYVHEDQQMKDITLNVVDYQGLYQESLDSGSGYSRLLGQLKQFDPATLPSRESRIAFWINAYNIGAIKMIVDHYPVDSIRSVKINLFKNPWKKEVLNIQGRLYRLGEIEHEILLGEYQELMAHFAVVCASLSCPELLPEVYTGEKLRTQLEHQAKKFMNNRNKGYRIDRSRNRVYVSKIFRFDAKNFSKGRADIIPFVLPLIENDKDRDYLKNGSYELGFLDYDWDLNSLQGQESSR